MNGTQIIEKFELYSDDMTELSSDEELDLANSKISFICNLMPWEWLRKQFSGTINAQGSITAPTDFVRFLENYSENQTSDMPDTKVVYLGSGNTPYKVVPMGGRNNFNQINGVYGSRNICWYNRPAGTIEFPSAQTPGTAVSFDYVQKAPAITLGTEPIIPEDFHMMIVYLMLIDDEVIQKMGARSEAGKWNALYQQELTNLKAYNFSLIAV